MRNNASLIQAKAGPASQANAAASVKANAASSGDVMVAKIAGAKVLKGPADGAPELMSLTKADEVLLPRRGEERLRQGHRAQAATAGSRKCCCANPSGQPQARCARAPRGELGRLGAARRSPESLSGA